MRVTGYWPDNWIEQRLEVFVATRDTDRELVLAGRSVLPMTLEISANGTRLGEFQLAAQGQETVQFRLPPGPPEIISFVFSDHVVDPAGRRIAFLLQETNVFSEEDLASRG
jgi:hypothetical protein